MEHASKVHGVPLGILYAVGLTETGRRYSLHPYAINFEGKSAFAGTLKQGVSAVRKAQRRGIKLIDVGCMQINTYYHSENFSSLASMFNPRRNVDYAARFLKRLRVKEGSWTMAVARYHAGPNNNPAQKRYVCKVITNMVASGFGEWTPQSKKFCN
ncbi:lytic transglycosylase domain-containing protein [Flexibacterium corallicola]|uniref:lytic transglycosylase domain-containing protein n=1 Tax=Flexibacterium corallicola TaxID=3037259 RepID=UPI00286F0012|nr:lytic transglycosylase domain-containing protein [Pseudovibrio sp. M1P-2-3]